LERLKYEKKSMGVSMISPESPSAHSCLRCIYSTVLN